MADIATLVFDIESGPARTAATDLAKLNQAAVSLANSVDKTNAVLRDSSGRFKSSAQVVAEYGDRVYQLAGKFNPALKAAYDYQRRQVEVADAVRLGVLSQRQAEAALKSYADELRRIDPVIKAQEAAEKAAADELRRKQQVIERLHSAYTPLYAASKKYEASLDELNEALSRGYITGNQYESMLSTLNARYAAVSTAADGAVNKFGVATHKIQNFGYQIGDAAVQIGGGVSPIVAINQQLPQLLGSFGAVGAVAGAAAAVLGAVWMGFSSGANRSRTLKDQLDKLAESNSSLKRSIENVNAPMKELYDRFGPAAAKVRELYVAQTRLNISVARGELSSSINSLNDSLSKYTDAVSASRSASGRAWDAIKADLGLAGTAASDFVRQLREIERETSTGLKVQKFQDLVKWLEAAGVAVDKLPPEFSKAALQMTNLNIEAIELEKLIKDATSAAGAMPGAFNAAADAAAKITDRLNEAVSAANRLAASAVSDVRYAQIELDFRTDKVAKAGALAAAKFDEEVGKGVGMDAVLFNKLRNEAIAGAKETARILQEVERLNEADRAKNKSSGGGSALKQAQNRFQSLRELLEQETLFEFAEWEKRQAQLDLALQKRLLSEQNYQILKDQLETHYFGSEYEKAQLNYQLKQEQLDLALAQDLISRQRHAEEIQALESAQRNASLQGYSTLFGNMASIAKAGGDKATGVVKAFSIAQGLLNSYLAFTQVLADPSLIGRPFLRTALAYSTLGAGLAQVAAMRGGGGGGGSASASVSSAATSAASQQIVEYKIYGDSFGADLVEDVLTQIQRQQKDGNNLIIRRA